MQSPEKNSRIPCTRARAHTHTQDLQGGLIQDTGQVVKKRWFLKRGLTLLSTICLELLPLSSEKRNFAPPFHLYLQASGCLTSHRREDYRTWSEYQTWSSHSTINLNGTLGKLLALLSLYSIPFKMDKDIATHPSSSWGFSDDWCRWKIKL